MDGHSRHKHDSNHVVTSLVRVLGDVRTRRGLSLVVRIQADNHERDNKNKYRFVFCTIFVVLGNFREVQLNFFIVGRTFNDVDQQLACSQKPQNNKTC